MCCCFKDRGPVRGPGWIRGGSMCVAVSKIGVLLEDQAGLEGVQCVLLFQR